MVNHESRQCAVLTCGAEQEGGRFSQVPVHCVSEVHLSVGEGAERLFVGRTHFRLDVVEQQREGAAAKLFHLRQERLNFPHCCCSGNH